MPNKFKFKSKKPFVDRDGYRYVPYNEKEHALYKAMFVRNFTPEHRLIMAQKLQRALDRAEHVHHKDHNRLNNVIDNLDIINVLEHIDYHKKKGNLKLFSKKSNTNQVTFETP